MKLIAHSPLPGIVAGLETYPHTGGPLRAVAHQLLLENEHSTLTRLERECIATLTSYRNGCVFCTNSHAAVVVALHHNQPEVLSALWDGHFPKQYPALARISPVLQFVEALLTNTPAAREHALQHALLAGFPEADLHEAAAISAAFRMFNAYVEALNADNPSHTLGDWAPYAAMGERIVANGYQH